MVEVRNSKRVKEWTAILIVTVVISGLAMTSLFLQVTQTEPEIVEPLLTEEIHLARHPLDWPPTIAVSFNLTVPSTVSSIQFICNISDGVAMSYGIYSHTADIWEPLASDTLDGGGLNYSSPWIEISPGDYEVVFDCALFAFGNMTVLGRGPNPLLTYRETILGVSVIVFALVIVALLDLKRRVGFNIETAIETSDPRDPQLFDLLATFGKHY